MSTPGQDDLSSFSLVELFRVELDTQKAVLTEGLLALERDPAASERLEALMRAAHSLKGAASIVNFAPAVAVAHVMEDCFVAAQQGRIPAAALRRLVDVMLAGVDLLTRIAQTEEADIGKWSPDKSAEVRQFLADVEAVMNPSAAPATAESPVAEATAAGPAPTRSKVEPAGRFLRVTAESLNRMLALAGETQVEARRLRPFADTMFRLKRQMAELTQSLDGLREALSSRELDEHTLQRLVGTQDRVIQCRQSLAERLNELDVLDRRATNVTHRLYSEALAVRMRPFADGVQGMTRMVRDLARRLGKEARLVIQGESTQVDRDILENLEAPLGHLLRNGVDHGIEFPADRVANGKPAEGTIRLEARHSGGVLLIEVSDDGGGVDLGTLREAVVLKHLTTPQTAAKLSEQELLSFLFLPGFSMKETVTDISGRGVGLDVVHEMVKSVRGTIRVTTQPGQGVRFQLQLPLTLSVVRTLLVEIAGEPFAFPLASIQRSLKLPRHSIETMDGRQRFFFEGRAIGLITSHQVFERGEPASGPELSVIVLGEREQCHGLVVDRFLGEQELVVQALDSRLGKLKDITAGALMEDGSPVLIVDVEDLVRSIELLISGGRLSEVKREGGVTKSIRKRKRVLVVDDSLTVRELERKVLEARGYAVELAVDGMDGWNAVRTGQFDLVVSDVDMPRLDGVELISLIKRDPRLQALPVIIVSYKDREEDRQRGLAAGASFYLTKGSFHDETFLHAVEELIGRLET